MINRLIGSSLVLVLALGLAARAADFSADVETRAKGKTISSRMNYAGDKWRLESTAAGKKTVSILRSDKKVVWTILPDQRLYIEHKMQPEHQRGMTAKQPGEMSRKKIGRETVNGIAADKYEVTYRNGRQTEKMHQWISDDKLPVKSAAVDGSWSTELKNVKMGQQAVTLFSVPAGYNKMTMPTMRLPAGVKVNPLLRNMRELPDQK
jgi:hypothetical protein